MSITSNESDLVAAVELQADKPLKIITEEIGLNSNAVTTNLVELQRSGVVKKVPLLNCSSLGLSEHVIYFQASPAISNKLIDMLIRSHFVNWVVRVKEQNTFGVCCINANLGDFTTQLENLLLGIDGCIDSKEYVARTNFTLLGRNFLSDKKISRAPLSSTRTNTPVQISALEQRAIEALSTQRAFSLDDITAQLKISKTDAENLIQGLEQKGVILGFIYEVNPQELGYRYYKILISTKSFGPKLSRTMLDFADRSNNVWYLAQCFGDWDYELGVDGKDSSEIDAFLKDLSTTLPGQIAEIQTYEVESYLKRDNYSF